MVEYLRYEDPLLPDELAFELMNNHQMLAPAVIGGYLEKAREYLINTPGPNQLIRKELEPSWLGYWITQMNQLGGNLRNIRTQRLGDIDFVGQKISELNNPTITGFCSMATGEGTPGHRHFVAESYKQVSNLCIALEGPKYFEIHYSRRKPFLPLALRVSMWLLERKYNFVTILPTQESFSATDHYRKIHQRSKATLSLTSEDDPNSIEKAFRGFRPSTMISELDSPHTSDRVEKLMPDVEDWEIHEEKFVWCQR